MALGMMLDDSSYHVEQAYAIGHEWLDNSDLLLLPCVEQFQTLSNVVLEVIKNKQELHMDIVMKALLEKDLALCSVVIDMYTKCILLAEARQEFDKLKVHDVVLWNALIRGYAKHKNVPQVLFDEMKVFAYSPDAITYACAISRATCKGKKQHVEIKNSSLLE
ncbi:hypothetical protein L7F22_014300 [Adiantum nelumboides]|nr:hypothetical protein [Adiantum nelumboides]